MSPVTANDSTKAAESQTFAEFSSRDFRDALGQFATGVVVISTQVDGDTHAMTANAFMSGSLEPPLVLVSVACAARMHEKIKQARRFGVSVLACDQHAISDHFAGRVASEGMPGFEALQDLDVVANALVQIVTDLEHVYACGDHTLFVGRVTGLRRKSTHPGPLLFHGGRYGVLNTESSVPRS